MSGHKGALQDDYEMSQKKIGEIMHYNTNEIQRIEKKAIANFKRLLAERGINVKDLLED